MRWCTGWAATGKKCWEECPVLTESHPIQGQLAASAGEVQYWTSHYMECRWG